MDEEDDKFKDNDGPCLKCDCIAIENADTLD